MTRRYTKRFPEEEAILAIVEAMEVDDFLHEHFVLKGGNALRLAYHGVRASVDLDFTSIDSHAHQEHRATEALLDEFCSRLNQALESVKHRFGFTLMSVQKACVQPRHLIHRTFPSLEISVGYSRNPQGRLPLNDSIRLDVSLNDVVCEDEYVEVGESYVHISSLDDIIAEKLRALLQQIPRNRNRPNDVYDIWFYWTHVRRILDFEKIASFLVHKSRDRDQIFPITRESFYVEEIRQRASVGFDAIQDHLPPGQQLPSFDDAFAAVLALVDELNMSAVRATQE